MASFSTIRENGQVTLPKEIREGLGLHDGDVVEFLVEAGRTVLRPAETPVNPFDEYIGAFPAFRNRQEIDEWVREVRGERPL